MSFTGGNYIHFGLYIATMPTVARLVAGTGAAANQANLLLNTDGTLTLRDGTTIIATTTTVLSTAKWYWIGIKNIASATGTLLQLSDDTSIAAGTTLETLSGTYASGATIGTLGCFLTEASAIDLYIDDYLSDDAGFLTNGAIAFVRPVSDDTVTNWTAGAGGTTNLWTAVDNQPPSGLASANETNTTNIESASSTGTATYIAQMAAYDTLGLVAFDMILAVQITISQGEDIATGTKNGTFECTTNPVIGSTAFIAGSDGGAHGAELNLWVKSRSTLALSPSLTLSSGPKVKLVKTDTTTRTLCVDYVAINVAYIPAVAGQVPYVNPMPPLIAQ